jgi:hypothetical protein
MGQAFSSIFTSVLDRLLGSREMRVVMLGLDAAGKVGQEARDSPSRKLLG